MAKSNVTAATPSEVPQAAPGIPEVQVDPTNELLDGENLDRKRDVLENEPVKVDASGRRLVHEDVDSDGVDVDAHLRVPPAAANLELRQRTEKFIDGMLGSIGKGPESPDSMLDALREEKRGLQARADGGDERAKRRLGQVEQQLRSREQAAQARRSDAESRAQSSPASSSVSQPPAGRTGVTPGKTTA